jgi:PAS domain S-box-containing protein
MRIPVPSANPSDAALMGQEPDGPRATGPQAFRALVESAADIVWRADSDGRFDSDQHSFSRFTGLEVAECAGDGWLQAIHPDDRAASLDAWQQAVRARNPYASHRRIRRHDGRYRRMLVRALPILDAAGEIAGWIGADFDQTERFVSERRLAHVLERMGEALLVVDAEWNVTQANGRAAELAGRAGESLVGLRLEDVMADLDEGDLRAAFVHAQRMHEPLIVDAWDTRRQAWFETRAYPLDDGLAVFRRDISDRKRAELRSRFLSQASAVLFSSLDLQETLETLAGLVVPAMADSCVVDLIDGDRLDRVVVVHRDPELEALVRQVAPPRLSERTADHPFRRAIESRTTVHLLHLDAPLRLRYAVGIDPELSARLDPTSVLVVPLIGRDRVLGLLSLSTFHSRRPFDEHDREVADALGQRVAIAIDNAQNWGRARAEIEVRRRTEQALRSSEERFGVAQHLSLDGFTLLRPERDETGAITDFIWEYANPAAMRLLRHGSLEGRRLFELFPGLRAPDDESCFTRVAGTGRAHDAEHYYDADGVRGWFRLMVVRLGDRLAVSISDITPRKAAAEEERARARELELLYDTSRALAEARLDLPRMLDALAERIAGSLGDACVIRLLSATGRLDVVACRHADPSAQTALRRLVKATPVNHRESPYAVALAENRTVLIAEGSTDSGIEAYRPFFETRGFRGAMVAPLSIHGRDLGTLLVLREGASSPFRDSDRIVLQEIAERTALSLDNGRLFQVERRLRAEAEATVERLTRLQRITAALSRALPLQDVLDVIIEQVLESVGAFAGGVVEISPDGREFVLLHSVGFNEETQQKFARFSTDLPLPVRDVLLTQQPVFLDNRAEWSARYAYPARVDGGDGAWAAVPLLAGDSLIGVLTLSFASPRPFSETDREYMLALASQCGRALERARLYDAERDARREAERANLVKSQFLGVMSHELRTPLNAVVGYTELLLLEIKGPLAPEQRAQLERIRTAASVQMQLIEEILAYARIEAGREEVRMGPADLSRIVEEVAELLRPMATPHDIALRLDLPTDPVQVVSDSAKLRQILLNLGGNAVKFTAQGEVEFRIWREPRIIAVSVRDTGPGIPKAKQRYIFEPFAQLDQAHTREHGGTGLGLAITQRLARLLGGEVHLDSVVGQGSTFTLVLPNGESPG